METVVTPSACAPARPGLSRPSPLTGLQTPWPFTIEKQFPANYRKGLFIAFHGSWDRAPYAQGGYNIVYQGLTPTGTAGRCEIFADGFSGGATSPGDAQHRPSGVAVGPDGSLYVSDDVKGRIYKIIYKGSAQVSTVKAAYRPCPSLTASPGEVMQARPSLPRARILTLVRLRLRFLPARRMQMVALGDRIFHGQVAGAMCTACHGTNGAGTPLGPDLTKNKWLWSDGSWAGITKTITTGVMQPKQFRSPMPPNGGTQLTPEQSKAVAAYVWSLSHR